MKKVIITCDSAADLNNLVIERNIDVIPLIVCLGANTYYDGVTICPDDIYKYVEENGTLPKTAARNEQDFYEFFNKHVEKGYEVVHYSISKEFSLMSTQAKMAADRLKGVYVVDTRSLSTGIGLVALYGCDLRDQGKSAQEIYNLSLMRTDYVQASFVIDNMEYLQKGGRCSGIAAVAATALMIKPTIYVSDGEMKVGKKYFPYTARKAIPKYVTDTISHYNNPHRKRAFITHSSVSDDIVQAVKEKILNLNLFDEIHITVAGATITSHCGKGTLGILYINDGDKFSEN